MKKLFSFSIFVLSFMNMLAQFTVTTTIGSDEKWWGGAVGITDKMPFSANLEPVDLSKKNFNNQTAPFLISNKGRYIWSPQPFEFQIENNILTLKSETETLKVNTAGNNLREAFLTACKANFSPTTTIPEAVFFAKPQYNTWIELMYNQNQADILNYANKIIENGLPTGVLMIDDNWQKQYGNFEFRPDKFPNPKAMVSELHQKGFPVILWISPFVSADSPEYRFLKQKGYLLKTPKNNQPAIFDWWNGKSAQFDLSNPAAFNYLRDVLKKMQANYGIDGFKFDAGDVNIYNTTEYQSYDKKSQAVEHSELWAKLGLQFPFNEYRACWKQQGQPLIQRLADKDYSWEAIRELIPQMLTAGIMGYPYICPDMIGGGQFTSFLNIDQTKMDQELIVRSAQVHALAPMMQFSVAPWRILDKEHLAMVKSAAELHVRFGAYILEMAKIASISGEPIMRMMEYEFPNQGFEICTDQFMLGSKYLVAPMTEKGNARSVKLPNGKWVDDQCKKYNGGKTIVIDVPLNRLPYFEKVK